MTENINCSTENLHLFIEKNKWGYDYQKVYGKFEYYVFERDLINHFHNNQLSIIRKSRQIHVSSNLALYAAWNLMNNKNVIYVGGNSSINNIFMEKVYNILKDNNEVNFIINRKDEKVFSKGIYIKTLTPKSSHFCSLSIDNTVVIIDEGAFMNNLKYLIDDISYKLACSSKLILTSTPNGFNEFFDLYMDSINLKNDFKPLFINYLDNPRLDEKWLKTMKDNLNELEFKQEVLGEFVHLNNSVTKTPKNKIIQTRIDDELYQEILINVQNKNISNYIRELILKDMNK